MRAFVGFGDQIVILVASVLMLSAAIGASDVIERVILVSRMREELTGEPFALFDFIPVGLSVAGAAFAFLAFGLRQLPNRHHAQASASAPFEVEPYLSEARSSKNSPLIGKTVAQLEPRCEGEVAVTAIIREGGHC